MKTDNKSKSLILDPKELIDKVENRYGKEPIFPKKTEELKQNLDLYRKK
jgi:hypothetical protein